GKSLARQIIRDHKKWIMAGQGFIASLRAGAGNEKNARKWACSRRTRQRARERCRSFPVCKPNFLFLVRIGFCGILRAAQLKNLIRTLELERNRVLVLRPLARDCVSRRI